jgi:hypothetical protein
VAFVEQVGGDHYQAELQHWDVCEQYDVGYLEGNATKYMMRWRKKGKPAEDLGKACSYVEKALADRPGQGARRLVPGHVLAQLYRSNNTDPEDAALISLLLGSGSHEDFGRVLNRLHQMLVDAAAG